MRVAVAVSGTRGDVQPMLALAMGLNSAGHDAIFCGSRDNEDWARSLGVAFEPVGEALHDNPSLGDWGIRPFGRFIRRQIEAQVSQLPPIVKGCDVIVASGLAWGVRPVAEHLQIPYRYVSFVPAAFLGTTRDPIGVRLKRGFLEAFANFAYGHAVDNARATLGLPRRRGVMAQMLGAVPLAATDPALTIVPDRARLLSRQTGYPVLDQPGELAEPLARFLADGPKPVYAGFGSMLVGDRARMARLLVEAAKRACQRMVIARGWAGIADIESDETRILVDDVPHRLLFPRLSAVIHHGGAGTVATAARAGVPQIVLPKAVDQYLWREQLVELGLAPRTPRLSRASAESVAAAIEAVTTDPAYGQRATEMAVRLAGAANGVTATIDEITSARGAESH